MNILHIPPYTPPIEGGSERFCFNLCKLLMKNNHNVKVLTSTRDSTQFRVVEGVPCYSYRNYWHMLQLNPLSIIYGALKETVEWADVVHVHSYIYFLSNQVALYRRKNRFPFILHLHGGTSPITTKVYGATPAMAKILYDVTIGKWTVKTADFLLASSKNDRDNAISRFGADPDRIMHIPNSVYVDEFYKNPQNPPIVTFLARLTQLKGCYHLPSIIKRVWNEHKDTRFWIVGEGYVEEFLRKELKGLPVKFWGMIPHAQVPEVLSQSSVSFLPSYTESCPLSILESLASSVPVVANNVGGIPEIIQDGETGFITPVEDTRAMADRIIFLLDNEDVRMSMGRKGRKFVEEKHSWKKTVLKIQDVYEALL